MLRKYKVLCSVKELKQCGFDFYGRKKHILFREISPTEYEQEKAQKDDAFLWKMKERRLYCDTRMKLLYAYDIWLDMTINCRKNWVKDLIDKGYVEELC